MSKKLFALLLTLAVFAALAVSATASTRTINIVMKDPGCHWFFVGGKDKSKLTVPGPTVFRNLDEATLIFKGPNGTKLLHVGKTLLVSKAGVYHITMVGQKPDDNHLLLTVR